MGGCKCTYRSCARSSDGKTHFFHYPIKDIERRNQWLVNSNRLEFLKLTLPQLRNKVVCEHHFSENMFMNYKHDRLVHDAVPNKEQMDVSPVDTKEMVSFKAAPSLTPTDPMNCSKLDPIKCSEQKEKEKRFPKGIYRTVLPKTPINLLKSSEMKASPKEYFSPPKLSEIEYQPKNNINNEHHVIYKGPIQRNDMNIHRSIEKEIMNQNITLTNDGVDEMHNKHIIILPMEKEVTLPDQKQIENQTPTHDNSEYAKLVKDGSQVMNQLKFLIERHKRMTLRKLKMKVTPPKRKIKTEWKPLPKASLYAQIVPYLSPELAKMVHKEMFPSMRHMHRM